MLAGRNNRQTRWVIRLAAVLLITTLLVLAWLQYLWLSQLRNEELGRRQVVMAVLGERFADRFAAQLDSLMTAVAAAPDNPTELPAGIASVVQWSEDGTGRILAGEGAGPVSSAALLQILGRPLLAWPAGSGLDQRRGAQPSLWLQPPALVQSGPHRRAYLLDTQLFADNLAAVLESTESSGADSSVSARVVLVEDSGWVIADLLPTESPWKDQQADWHTPLTAELPVAGPANRHWELRLRQGEVSLTALVASSHTRNLLLAAVTLLLMAAGLWLLMTHFRRQQALAQQQILFAASASHELRTPLAVIASAADNLASGTISDPARVREYGQLMSNEAAKLAGLIGNVLQFSQSSAQPSARAEVPVQPLIDSALKACAASLAGFELKVDIKDGPATVQGDRRALQSVLENLLTNAAKYAEGERWIGVSSRRVTARLGRSILAISVTNPVRGRLESDTDRWFEPFARGAAAIERGVPGTGIGLSVAQAIAYQHGGGLNVHVEQKRWVRFTLYLPLDD